MPIPKPKLGRVVKEPATPGGDGLTALCEDLMRIMVSANGGFPITPTDAGREIVRQARDMYSEIDKATERKGSKSTARVLDGDSDDVEDEDYGR